MALPAHHAPFAETYRRAGSWLTGDAPDHLRLAAARDPEREALSDARGALTYAELDAQVRRLAAGFLAWGVKAGDVVAIQLPNRREFALAQQAAARIGAVYVPLLPQLRLGDLEPLLNACKAKVLVTLASFRGFDHAGLARELHSRVKSLQHVLIADQDFDAFMAEPWEDRFGEAVDAVRIDADTVRTILFTSGTESTPKGVLHSFNTLFFGLKRQVELFGFGAEDVVLCASPVGHGTGAVNGVEFALQIGGKVTLLEAWSPKAGLELIARERCTLMWGAATFFTDLSAAAPDCGLDLSSFRLALTAGAPIPRELVTAVRDKLGALLVAAYGQSEGQNIAINRPDDSLERITGSDGRIHDAIDFKLVAGEFAYRGPNACMGFLHPAHTAKSFDADGYLYSGDLAEVDAERYLRIVGRRKDIIIRGGENISPAEIEDILFGHPKIKAVSVVGYPDPRFGQRACAVVEPAVGAAPSLQDLIDWMAARNVAKFKYPERILLVDGLPLTPSGKVRKEVLRARLAEEVAA
jgi:acyl-CoA synthetase (AMP-forming)/AMP-acid ligase II